MLDAMIDQKVSVAPESHLYSIVTLEIFVTDHRIVSTLPPRIISFPTGLINVMLESDSILNDESEVSLIAGFATLLIRIKASLVILLGIIQE